MKKMNIPSSKKDEYLNEALAMPYKWLKKNAEEIVNESNQGGCLTSDLFTSRGSPSFFKT